MPQFTTKGKIKCCGILEKPVYATLLDASQPFSLRAFRFELPFVLFLFKLSLPLHAPFIVAQGAFAIMDLSGQDHLDRDVCHSAFEFLSIIILPARKH